MSSGFDSDNSADVQKMSDNEIYATNVVDNTPSAKNNTRIAAAVTTAANTNTQKRPYN